MNLSSIFVPNPRGPLFSPRRCPPFLRKALEGAALVLGAAVFAPWRPIMDTGFIEYAPHLAFGLGWRQGFDIVFNYGPTGFLGTPLYFPATYGISLAANLLVYGFSAAILRALWRGLREEPAPGVWILALFALISASPAREWGGILFLPSLLAAALLLLHFAPAGGSGASTELSVAFLAGALAWMKADGLAVGVLAVGTAAADDIIRRRKPLQLPAFCGGVFLTWVAARQKPGDLIPFLLRWREYATGYRRTLSLWFPETPLSALLFAAVVCVLAPALHRALKERCGRRAAVPATAWLAVQYATFMHGFIVADWLHVMSAYLSLAAQAALLWPLRKTEGPVRPFRPGIGTALAFAGLAIVRLTAREPMSNPLPPLLRKLEGAGSFLAEGPRGLSRQWSEMLSDAARKTPLSLPKAPVDIPAGDLSLALANGLPFRPRPTFITQAAVTPELGRLNRDYLEGPAGPAAILWEPSFFPMVGVHPVVIDGPSYLSLLTHFRLTAAVRRCLVFERRPRPLALSLKPLWSGRLAFGQSLSLPKAEARPLWAVIRMRYTVAGRLLSAAFSSYPVRIEVLSGGERSAYHLPLELAAEGFLISPHLHGPRSFYRFYNGEWEGGQDLRPVDAVRITQEPSGRAPALYEREAEVELYEVEIGGSEARRG